VLKTEELGISLVRLIASSSLSSLMFSFDKDVRRNPPDQLYSQCVKK
jgi:hypothetical protein